MEQCIHKNVYANVNNIINQLQHGFIGGKSCATQRVKVYDKVSTHLDLNVI